MKKRTIIVSIILILALVTITMTSATSFQQKKTTQRSVNPLYALRTSKAINKDDNVNLFSNFLRQNKKIFLNIPYNPTYLDSEEYDRLFGKAPCYDSLNVVCPWTCITFGCRSYILPICWGNSVILEEEEKDSYLYSHAISLWGCGCPK